MRLMETAKNCPLDEKEEKRMKIIERREKSKRIIILNGSLLGPLQIGKRAIVYTGGELYRTSKVVAIQEKNIKRVCFETENTHYQIQLEPHFHALMRFLEYQATRCA